MLAKVKAMVILYYSPDMDDYNSVIEKYASPLASKWGDFLDANSDKVYRVLITKDLSTNEERISYNWSRQKMRAWMNSSEFEKDVKGFFVG